LLTSLFDQMLYYALCLSYHSNTEAVLFACHSSRWATTKGRLLGLKVGNSIKCLSQGHNDALSHWDFYILYIYIASGLYFCSLSKLFK